LKKDVKVSGDKTSALMPLTQETPVADTKPTTPAYMYNPMSELDAKFLQLQRVGNYQAQVIELLGGRSHACTVLKNGFIRKPLLAKTRSVVKIGWNPNETRRVGVQVT
jgi:hypothetical protein